MLVFHTVLQTLVRRIYLKSNLYPLVVSLIVLVFGLTLPLAAPVIMRWFAVIPFESVNEILWCYHSNETPSAVLSHGAIESVDEILWCYRSNESFLAEQLHETIYFLWFYKRKFGVCCEFSLWLLFRLKRLISDILERNKMLFQDKSCFAVAQHVLPSISLLLADFPLNNQRAH